MRSMKCSSSSSPGDRLIVLKEPDCASRKPARIQVDVATREQSQTGRPAGASGRTVARSRAGNERLRASGSETGFSQTDALPKKAGAVRRRAFQERARSWE